MPTTSTDPFSSGYSNLAGTNTGGSGGFGSGNAGVAPLPGSGDPLTTFFRSLSNLTGTTGANLTGAGGQTTAAGLGTAGQGLGVQGSALNTLQPSIDFYTKILSGDPTAMEQALAPTATTVENLFQSAQSTAGMQLPQGGYRSTVLAGLPQAAASKVGDAALSLQPNAAAALTGAASTEAGIGQGISNTGLGVAGVGSTQTSQGLQALMSTIQAALAKMGINIQGGFANQFGQIAQGIGALV